MPAAILAAGPAAGHVPGCQAVPAAGVHRQAGDGRLERGDGPDAAAAALGGPGHRHAQAQARRVLRVHGTAAGSGQR